MDLTTDTSEKGLESLIVEAMTGVPGGVAPGADGARKPPTPYGGTGWLLGSAEHYNREHAVDLYQLLAFLQTTQAPAFDALLTADQNRVPAEPEDSAHRGCRSCGRHQPPGVSRAARSSDSPSS